MHHVCVLENVACSPCDIHMMRGGLVVNESKTHGSLVRRYYACLAFSSSARRIVSISLHHLDINDSSLLNLMNPLGTPLPAPPLLPPTAFFAAGVYVGYLRRRACGGSVTDMDLTGNRIPDEWLREHHRVNCDSKNLQCQIFGYAVSNILYVVAIRSFTVSFLVGVRVNTL